MRILWASPLPPVRSGVADYAIELIPALSQLAEIRLVSPSDGSGPEPGSTVGGCPVISSSTPAFENEIQLVHLGNNPYHRWLIDRIHLPRTSVVLHDAVLHHLLVEATLAEGNERRFEGYLLDAHPDAEAIVKAREIGVTGRLDPFMFPARRAFLQGVDSVVVHSQWAAEQVSRDLPELPVGRVGLSVADPGPANREALRTRLGVEPHELLIMHLGYLTPEKGMGDVFAGFAAARAMDLPVRLVIVGEGDAEKVLGEAAQRLGLHDSVSFSGWIPNNEFSTLPAAADLGVVLRSPSAGETSAAALRFLACGTPVAVSGIHQFLELPELAAARITPGPSAAADLTRLFRTALDRDGWQARRDAARLTYEQGHTPEIAAKQLVSALRRMTG